jgi:release factor glutamine methyltransferase
MAPHPAVDVRSALKLAMACLRAAGVASHTLAAELLLMHALGRDRTWLYTNPEAPLSARESEEFLALVERRTAGEPTQYLTGKQEFWGLEFDVTPAVLIPRPETEHLVEIALERLGPRGIQINFATGAPSPALRIADVGTGSGCLAVALAHELPHAEIVATDISASALEVARGNAARHGVANRVRFLETDLLQAVWHEARVAGHALQPFDLLVSNPPYVAERDATQLPREVAEHEPHSALFGGSTGTEIYSRLIEQAAAALRSRAAEGASQPGGNPRGILILELGYGAADRVREMLVAQACWVNIQITNDLAGIPRVIAAERR